MQMWVCFCKANLAWTSTEVERDCARPLEGLDVDVLYALIGLERCKKIL